MSARIVLLTPARRFIANRYGLGYQIPLGLVLIGGPLVDAGHTVWLVDNDLYGWKEKRLAQELRAFAPDVIMLGHTGSTAAHPTCIETARQLRADFPATPIVYGGVYPTYAAEKILNECAAIDVVVRGEGEATVPDLLLCLQEGGDLAQVAGIAFRDGDGAGGVRVNRLRPPIQNLDAYRPGWELLDWQGYSLFGVGRAAGMQFSRGCPLTCTYCGQWLFWRRWRHRSPQNVVQELTTLARDYGVRIVWFADENFAADREQTRQLLEALVKADLDLSLNVNMTAADVVRDADLLPLYKAAGVDYVVMGVESLEDPVVAAVRKNNPFQVSQQAAALLREQHIISLVNIIYGLEDETAAKLWRKLRRLLLLGPDILNAVYLTPHFWTKDGRETAPETIIQPDQSKWTYRNQIIRAPHLSPPALFAGVKLTEALFHLRPSALWRLFAEPDRRVRLILRRSLTVGLRVVLAEIAEFVFATRFAAHNAPAPYPLPREVESG